MVICRKIKKILPAIILLASAGIVFGQKDSLSTIDVSKINKVHRFFGYTPIAFVDPSFRISDLKKVSFIELSDKNYMISAKNVSKKILLKTQVKNSGDSAQGAYFFPGFYYTNIQLYRLENDSVFPLPSILPDHPDKFGFRYVSVAPHDTVQLLVEITQLKTYNNSLSPRFVKPDQLADYMLSLQRRRQQNDFVTYIFCGLLLMMILFSMANYWLGRSREFLYYAIYAFLMGVMLSTKPFFYLTIRPISFFLESYFDFILQCVSICFYMAFMIRFLNTRQNHPFLHGLYKYGILGLIAVMLLFTWLHYGTDNFYAENVLENYVTKNVLLLMMVAFLIYSVGKWQDRLLRYLFWGNLLYFIFSLISILHILVPSFISVGILGDSLFYYEIGIFLELTFFLMGLAYKNRKQIIEQTREKEKLKLENERKEFEKRMAVMAAHQEERNRISADIHDELGSGMTTIRLMSEIAKRKMKENTPAEIDKISQSANDVLNKMNAIIWSMNSGNDTLDNLVSYIRAYSLEYFDGTEIYCKVDTPPYIPSRELQGDKRRNIFLCVKESLNNVLKHSGAKEVLVRIFADEFLVIEIIDNGVGIDVNNLRMFGNGLKNIARRMKSIGGSFEILNNNGVTTILRYPL